MRPGVLLSRFKRRRLRGSSALKETDRILYVGIIRTSYFRPGLLVWGPHIRAALTCWEEAPCVVGLRRATYSCTKNTVYWHLDYYASVTQLSLDIPLASHRSGSGASTQVRMSDFGDCPGIRPHPGWCSALLCRGDRCDRSEN